MNGDRLRPRAARSRDRRSFTLVLVLMALLLLSGIAVAFLGLSATSRSLSSSSAASARVELLARAALDTVVGDLLDEVAAGSTAHPSAAVPAATNVFYVPRTAADAVPQRIGSFNLPDVVKTSQAGLPAWYAGAGGSDGPVRVLADNGSDVRSANGLRVTPSRWLLPGLMGPALPAAFAAPGWILLTPSGAVDSRAGTPSLADLTDAAGPRFALGRFAYAVYDVGGLADITVEGGRLDAETAGRRFRAAQVSLGLIPGVLDAASIVAWRDGAGTNAATVLAPTNAFAALPDGGQTLLGRQDLLRFQKAHPQWLSADALPYLTVFSRAANRPLFTAPASVNARMAAPPVAYGSAATFSNPPEILDVRQADGGPLMRNRFPLSRLALLADPAGSAADIAKYFGLARAADGYSWVYRGATDSPILTLAQVAALTPAREPDFFEVLQAAILSGSLAQGGKRVYSNTTSGSPNLRDGESLVEARDRDNDLARHVFQVGANLIDQYDADDYPTIIQRTVASTQVVGNVGPVRADVAGIENLPYLSAVALHCYRPDQNRTDPDRVDLGSWFHFELWNPHQGAPQAGGGAGTPSLLRVVATEGRLSMQYSMIYSDSADINNPDKADDIDTPPIDYAQAYQADPDATPYQVQFSNSPSLSDPQYLMTGKFGAATPGPMQDFPGEGGAGQGMIGILAGHELCPSPPYPAGGATDPATGRPLALWAFGPVLQVDGNGRRTTWELQFRDAGGAWRTYQRFANFEGCNSFSNYGVYGTNPPLDGMYTAWANPPTTLKTGVLLRPFVRLDPRGERFGLALGGAFMVNQPMLSGKDGVNAGAPDNRDLFVPNKLASSSSALSLYPLAENLYTASPTLAASYMADRDGVVRHGDPDNANPANKADPLSITDAARLRKRPVVLDRPFQSVGEMGYAFRDVPWKTVDLSSADSGDAALLDFFTCEDPYGSPADRAADKALKQTALLRGKIDLNTRQAAVLRAAVDGSAAVVSTNVPGVLADPSLRFVSAGTSTVSNLVESLVAATKATAGPGGAAGSPLRTRGDLVAALAAAGAANVSPIKAEKEAVVRALADLGQTQTWNLMIDVVVQSGRYSPQAASAAAGNFLVSAERRYWLHVAIDRANGRVVDSLLEPVDE